MARDKSSASPSSKPESEAGEAPRAGKSPRTTDPLDPNDIEHGEGNYEATREYNKRTKAFVESGRVDEAARAAKPRDAREQKEMEDAEQRGKEHMKEEDPEITQPTPRKPGGR